MLFPALSNSMQREQLEADVQRLHSEYEQLVARQQERATEWEAAAKREDAELAHRKQVGGLL